MKFAAVSGAALLASAAAASNVTDGWPIWKRPCTEAEVALATGIHLNIVGQYAEYNGTLLVQSIESSANYTGPSPAFYVAKGKLQSDIQAGLNIRLFNQQIAPLWNPAIPGLDEYASDQQTEKAQVANLTGVYSVDGPVLTKLLSEIRSGIQLNEENLNASISECDFHLEFPPADESGS